MAECPDGLSGGDAGSCLSQDDVGRKRMLNMNQQDTEMQRVLNMDVMELRYIHDPFHEICKELSSTNLLEDLADKFGLNRKQFKEYQSMISLPKHPVLPAKAFFGVFLNENNVSLAELMRVLLTLPDKQLRMKGLVKNLWNAALQGNSTHFQTRETKADYFTGQIL